MKAKDIISVIEDIAPLALQESFDNSGLMIGNPDTEIKGVLICLDMSLPVLKEAVEKGYNMIISHHPLMFHPVKRIVGKSVKDKIIIEAIKNDIVLYSSHTNLDCSIPGVNYALGRTLELEDMEILQPKESFLKKVVVYVPDNFADSVRDVMFRAKGGNIGNYSSCSFNVNGFGTFKAEENSNPFVGEQGKLHRENEVRIEIISPVYNLNAVISAMLAAHPYEEPAYDIYALDNKFVSRGLGIIGNLKNAVDVKEFLPDVKHKLGLRSLRHNKLNGEFVKRIAICGGAGGNLIRDAVNKKADIYLTAEIRYNEFIDNEGSILLADIGHFESEQFVKNIIYDILIENFNNFAIAISESECNPVYYM